MITSLELKNFTAFSDFKIDFSPKINIIIGENGTGKTHLLKLAYALFCGDKLLNKQTELTNENLEKFLTERLLRLFLPLDDQLGKLQRIGAKEKAEVTINFAQEMLKLSWLNNSQFVTILSSNIEQIVNQKSVFIPAKESLSFMEGIISLYDLYKMNFDQTYRDIWSLLELPVIRAENLSDQAQWAILEIEKICGGKFIFSEGGRVTFKVNNIEYSANAIAEGFRKIGMLSRLLEVGAIQPAINGTLFWDEHESNLNPKLMNLLVEIILELARSGQQIILATHDYVLLKWFDLLMDKNKGDEVMFHSLYFERQTNNLIVNTTTDYLGIEPNSIDSTFESLINSELDKTMGSLGR